MFSQESFVPPVKRSGVLRVSGVTDFLRQVILCQEAAWPATDRGAQRKLSSSNSHTMALNRRGSRVSDTLSSPPFLPGLFSATHTLLLLLACHPSLSLSLLLPASL